MAATATLQRLLTWLSPAFPVGSFAWSAGLETAIADERITSAAGLAEWLGGSLAHGGLKTEAILLAQSHAASDDGGKLQDLADLALALTPASERRLETTLTGRNFAIAARTWPADIFNRLPDPCPYPVAVGAIAAAHDLGCPETLIAYLTSAVQTQVSVAVRLVPLGQTAGLQVIAGLEAEVARVAEWAASATPADIGGLAYVSDIAQMRHETLPVRVFRS